jgi:hypothetical protein
MNQAEKCAILSFLTLSFATGVTDTAPLNMASSNNNSKKSEDSGDRLHDDMSTD